MTASAAHLPVRAWAHEARRALGVDDLVLAVHDASFPSDPGEDLGHGSPYSRAALRLCAFADRLGFNGLQLGPQGMTTTGNRSPYDGTAFSRSTLSIDPFALHRDARWAACFDDAALEAARAAAPPAAAGRVDFASAERAHARALATACARLRDGSGRDLQSGCQRFRAEASGWLEHDQAFAAGNAAADSIWDVTGEGGSADEIAARYAFAQFAAHAQHGSFRRTMRSLGWRVLGDLQVGLSRCDVWRRERLLMPGYALGAPPSRTHPAGQPWGYPLLRPGSVEADAFFRARVRKAAREYDGLRVDHPHGLVCPWVYDRRGPDPTAAVQGGARLFESPDLPDHPALASYAIARPDQLDRTRRRYDDGWVRTLDAEQLARYGRRLETLAEELAAAGAATLACEVLSTCPYPLARVLEQLRVGRFRVTQKANPLDPGDVYRSDHAQPADWMMVGTHDTPPLGVVMSDWSADAVSARARYLSERLRIDEPSRPAWIRGCAGDRRELLRAMFAELFASPARHVVVFMSDFFGFPEVYNRPGVTDERNWTLRIPNDFELAYERARVEGTAMDVLGALALALRAKDETRAPFGDLAARLEEASRIPLASV